MPSAGDLAERLERQRIERERAERQRRAQVERRRAERERAARVRRAQLRRRHATGRTAVAGAAPAVAPQLEQPASAPRPTLRAVPAPSPLASPPRRPGSGGLLWPTAKALLAVGLVLAASVGLANLMGLQLPGAGASDEADSVSGIPGFPIDPGTPTGLPSGYVFPVSGPHDFGEKLARFGASRYGHTHEGQDIFGKMGEPEVAAQAGIVVDRGKTSGRYSGGRGNYLTIYSPEDNHSYVYMHMQKPPAVQLGEHVHAGELVGLLGCSGSCDGPHLHFEVRIGKASFAAKTKAIDPLPFLRQLPVTPPTK